MGPCWMNGSPQSRTSWASNWTSTPASSSIWPGTPRTAWPRPAAPLTTFLVGYAAAQGKGGPEAVAEAARKAAALALRWEEEER
ncbi:hypothetical protein SCANM63S_04333 [Streptomyces canarius]